MISKINSNQVYLIQEIVNITWPDAFSKILSKEQLEYMMDMMYFNGILEKQIESGQEFYIYFEDDKALGFIGLELNYQNENQIKIHKLYILPNQQGKGIGEQLIRLAEKRCHEINCPKLTLNVNRYNNAITFYEKLGFKNIKSVDIEVGRGYLMEDYVMEKEIM